MSSLNTHLINDGERTSAEGFRGKFTAGDWESQQAQCGALLEGEVG